jgi:hypothetical protein
MKNFLLPLDGGGWVGVKNVLFHKAFPLTPPLSREGRGSFQSNTVMKHSDVRGLI